MPELPEVEHAARCLRAWLDRRTVTKVDAPDTRIFRGSDRRAFARLLAGRSIERVDRRGKNLLLAFTGGVGVFCHLGMTGKWLRGPRPAKGRVPVPPHSRARLHLDDGSALDYCDPRMFGRIAVHEGTVLTDLPEICALGPDPVLDGIDPGALHAALTRSARPIKVALLDQAVLAGLGNIYVTEALFRAGIAPFTPGSTLSLTRVRALTTAIEVTLAQAFTQIGSGVIAYLSEGAHVDNPFLIYERGGKPCPTCQTTLLSTTLGGRTTTHCPMCQR